MCGIIAYTGKAELPVRAFLEAMGVMEILEEEADRDALGGHGAGVLFIPKEGNVILEKVGHNGEDGDRPALRLRDKLEGKGLLDVSSRIILAHVRRAARQNEHRTKDKRYSQPYLTECVNGKKIAAIHNGYVANYKELAENFVLPHSFESEDDADDFIIDSEILPHLHEELTARGENPLKMGELTGFNRDGGNTFFILDVDRRKSYLFHQGKTRGLLLFRGPGGFLLSSRRKPVEKILEMADLPRKAEIQIPPRSPFSLAIELPLMESWL
ncbi:MAG: hypothetical protein DRQ04_07575 [Candidatus Hydrothermota bacterium]|nr:MAG: hypothetical protein DRQ04_07575 [Candidatus Hydrothermae bacterium]